MWWACGLPTSCLPGTLKSPPAETVIRQLCYRSAPDRVLCWSSGPDSVLGLSPAGSGRSPEGFTTRIDRGQRDEIDKVRRDRIVVAGWRRRPSENARDVTGGLIELGLPLDQLTSAIVGSPPDLAQPPVDMVLLNDLEASGALDSIQQRIVSTPSLTRRWPRADLAARGG